MGASTENFYEDWMIEGPHTVLWLMKHVERCGGDPMAWFNKWIAELRPNSGERLVYELQVLCQVLWIGVLTSSICPHYVASR